MPFTTTGNDVVEHSSCNVSHVGNGDFFAGRIPAFQAVFASGNRPCASRFGSPVSHHDRSILLWISRSRCETCMMSTVKQIPLQPCASIFRTNDRVCCLFVRIPPVVNCHQFSAAEPSSRVFSIPPLVICSVFDFPAARETSSSPPMKKQFFPPAGSNRIGYGRFIPNRFNDVSIWCVSTSIRGRRMMFLNPARLSCSVSSSSEPPSR